MFLGVDLDLTRLDLDLTRCSLRECGDGMDGLID
jgi:hypothetical protein